MPPFGRLALCVLLAWLFPQGEGSPTCRVSVGHGWQSCSYFRSSDMCCAVGSRFQRSTNSTTLFGVLGATKIANVSFQYTAGGGDTFLLSRSVGCSSYLECFLLEPLPRTAALADGALVSVEVVLPQSDAAFKVASVDMSKFSQCTQPARRTANTTSEECKLLNGSNLLQFDVNGPDVFLKLHPPVNLTEIPTIMKSVCVKLFSSTRRFECNHAPAAELASASCLYQPYASDAKLLHVSNVTKFFNGTHKYRYHCALVYSAGVCPLTSYKEIIKIDCKPTTVTVKPPTPISLYLLVIAVGVAFVILISLCGLLRKRRTETEWATAPTIRLPQEQQPLTETPCRVVLLYCKDDGTQLNSIVRLLAEIIRDTGQVDVEDPYNGGLLMDSVISRVKNLINKDDTCIVLLLTRRGKQVRSMPLNDVSVFDRFFAMALRFMEENPCCIKKNRIFTLKMENDIQLEPWTNERVYLIPQYIEKLLNDIHESFYKKYNQANLSTQKQLLENYVLRNHENLR